MSTEAERIYQEARAAARRTLEAVIAEPWAAFVEARRAYEAATEGAWQAYEAEMNAAKLAYETANDA